MKPPSLDNSINQIDQINQAITALESQRVSLGDSVVDASILALHNQLEELEQSQMASRQRRLVTVLFLDIVNSTTLSQGLEPEEVLEVMGGALKRLSTPIEAFGGQVTQFMGDGFMAVFGLARVHENDARQAVRAGLAILAESRRCAEELEHRFHIPGFNIRIGINTGRVVPGRFALAESPLIGLTVNLAARLEQAAQAGAIYISHFTYQHIRGAFDVVKLSPIKTKGFAQPIPVYQVQSARPRTFRTFTRGVEGIKTSLIGRETELRQLKEVYNHAIQSRETQLVTVIGEAGVGKSRLLYEFDRWIAHKPSPVIAYKARASPQIMDVPFGLLREMISYYLDILTTDPVDLTRQKLVQELSTFLGDDAQMKAHFVGSLLGFDFSGSPYLQGGENDPKQLGERAQRYLTQYFSAIAQHTPTIFMLDDIHWADAPSLSFVNQLVGESPQLRLVVVLLARPSLTERYPGLGLKAFDADNTHPEISLPSRSHQLVINPLSRSASLELLDEILHNVEALPNDLRQQILDSADGNPFYLEEFIQALVDAKAIGRPQRGGHWKVDTQKLANFELPATLIALLEARLDSLSPSQRALVQQAAVIGRSFWLSALQVMRGEKRLVEADLKSLSQRGFIYLQELSTFAGTEEYQFHHTLLRDVAYQALLKSDRQAYHGKVAAWLIGATQDGGRTGEFTSVIAKHYESAGEQDLAADWYTQSGNHAINQGAPAQARLFFERALALLPSDSPDSLSAPDLERRWQSLAGYSEVLGILGETEARLADDMALVALAESIEDDQHLAEAYYRQGYYLGMSGHYAQELDAYTRGLVAARRGKDHLHEALILGLKVRCEVRMGNLEAAAETAAVALICAEQAGDDQVLARTLNNVSAYYTESGDLARAAQLLEQQLALNRKMGNTEGEVVGLSNLGYDYILLGMPEQAIPALQRSIELAGTIGHRSFCAYSRLNLALAHLRNGNPDSALAELDGCLPEFQAMNDLFGCAICQSYAAMTKEERGQFSEALAGFEQAAACLAELGVPGSLQDARAGVARNLFRVNNLDAAHLHTTALWNYLQQEHGAGMEFLLLGYETCAEIFSASGQAEFARQADEAGYQELMRRAARISLPEWRKSFLEHVPEHRRLQARWQEN